MRVVGGAVPLPLERLRLTAGVMPLFWAAGDAGVAVQPARAELFLSSHATFQRDETSVKRPEVYPFGFSLST